MAIQEVKVPEIHLHFHLPETAPDENKEPMPAVVVSTEEEEELARMQDLAEATEPLDLGKPHSRASYLFTAIREAGELRRLRGFTSTHQVEPKDRTSAEAALESRTENFRESLARACGACAHRNTCRILGKPEKWLDLHPTEKQRTRKDQEGIHKFKGRVEEDSLAHCDPKKAVKPLRPAA